MQKDNLCETVETIEIATVILFIIALLFELHTVVIFGLFVMAVLIYRLIILLIKDYCCDKNGMDIEAHYLIAITIISAAMCMYIVVMYVTKVTI